MRTLRVSMIKPEKNALRLDRFDRRQQIAVTGEEDDGADLTLRGKQRHVEAVHEVDTLLLEDRQPGRRTENEVQVAAVDEDRYATQRAHLTRKRTRVVPGPRYFPSSIRTTGIMLAPSYHRRAHGSTWNRLRVRIWPKGHRAWCWRNVTFRRSPVMRGSRGTRCSQYSCVSPAITTRSPCATSIVIGSWRRPLSFFGRSWNWRVAPSESDATTSRASRVPSRSPCHATASWPSRYRLRKQ